MHKNHFFLFLILVTLAACSSPEKAKYKALRQHNLAVSAVERQHDEIFFPLPKTESQKREPYPWESKYTHGHRRITKEFFRCRGHSSHPPIANSKNSIYYSDCGGIEHHSLPIRNGKEFIYPILIELLNHIQNHTEKKVIITCGHQCPTHHLYANPDQTECTSKHLIGAEVDFYVEGFEHHPQVIIDILRTYYETPFKRSTQFTQANTPSWFNKEIAITLYLPHEGRNLDNSHPYPYISIQVCYDFEKDAPVKYNWNLAHKGYLRSSSY